MKTPRYKRTITSLLLLFLAGSWLLTSEECSAEQMPAKEHLVDKNLIARLYHFPVNELAVNDITDDERRRLKGKSDVIAAYRVESVKPNAFIPIVITIKPEGEYESDLVNRMPEDIERMKKELSPEDLKDPVFQVMSKIFKKIKGSKDISGSVYWDMPDPVLECRDKKRKINTKIILSSTLLEKPQKVILVPGGEKYYSIWSNPSLSTLLDQVDIYEILVTINDSVLNRTGKSDVVREYYATDASSVSITFHTKTKTLTSTNKHHAFYQ
jgi:hypothetical protein